VAHAYPQWKGFECAPEGHLLDQLIDLSGPMGIAYERSVGFRKDFHAHDRPMIVLPRGSCVVTVQIAGDRTETHRIGAAVGLIVPSRVEHEDQAVSSIFDALALFPSLSLVTTVADDEGFPRASLTKLMSRPREFRRSAWLDRLAQEYVFARVVSRRESVKTRAFFERQLLVEILETALGRGKVLAQPRLAPDDTVMGRAVRYIEANLFSDVSLPTLAHHAFASPSTFCVTSAGTPARPLTRMSGLGAWRKRGGSSRLAPTPLATSDCSSAMRTSQPSPPRSPGTSARRLPPSAAGPSTPGELARPPAHQGT
jgi:hypothetical protein